MSDKKRTSATGRPSLRGLNLNQFLAQNTLLMRQAWLRRLLDPKRDIDAECGHPAEVTPEEYKKMFLRGDIAKRVISVLPEESWNESPQIFESEDETETEFETRWNELEDQLRIFSMLQRVDVLSGIGRFGVLLLGVGDGNTLEVPVPGINEQGDQVGSPANELLFLRAFDESFVKVTQFESDLRNPRYGLPKLYEISFEEMGGAPVGGQTGLMTQVVHWSRILHVADNRTCSEVYGQPRLEIVVNRILDIKKIAGGSGEMFWKGGFPGISLETNPSTGGEEIEFDKEATKQQLEAYMNGLQRYIATIGMQAKSLNVQVADPGPHLELQIRLVAMAMGVPWRVLVGSEAAQLASEQDTRSWYRRINRRRQEYLNPYVIQPLIERLVAIGSLPEPEEILINWPDLNTPSDIDKATVAEKKSNALAKYVQGGVDMLVDPFHYLTAVLGFKDDEARSMIDDAETRIADTGPMKAQTQPQPAPQPGQPQPGQPGQPQPQA